MSENDPAVLTAIGRLEGKIDAYASGLTRHDSDIDRLQGTVNGHGNTLAELKTTLRLVWGAIGLLIAVGAVVAPIMFAVGH